MLETRSSEPLLLAARDLVTLKSLTQAGMNLVSVTISPLCEAAGTAVPDLDLPRDCVLIALVRGKSLIYPRGDTSLQAWDRIFAVVDRESEDQLRHALTHLPKLA